MFPGYPIRAITNGVHPATWTHPAFGRLFDRLGAHWPHEPELLGRADLLPDDDVRVAHAEAKAELIGHHPRGGRTRLPPRHANPCLCPAHDRVQATASPAGRSGPAGSDSTPAPCQIVFAGKAHPHDEGGKELIAGLYGDIERLRGAIPMGFPPGYDIALARKPVSGADVWLNTPQPPLEAPGTSGMKAALNGVPREERAMRNIVRAIFAG